VELRFSAKITEFLVGREGVQEMLSGAIVSAGPGADLTQQQFHRSLRDRSPRRVAAVSAMRWMAALSGQSSPAEVVVHRPGAGGHAHRKKHNWAFIASAP
jgi:hypothetical protein